MAISTSTSRTRGCPSLASIGRYIPCTAEPSLKVRLGPLTAEATNAQSDTFRGSQPANRCRSRQFVFPQVQCQMPSLAGPGIRAVVSCPWRTCNCIFETASTSGVIHTSSPRTRTTTRTPDGTVTGSRCGQRSCTGVSARNTNLCQGAPAFHNASPRPFGL